MWLVEEWGVDRFREMIEQQMGDKLAKGVRCSSAGPTSDQFQLTHTADVTALLSMLLDARCNTIAGRATSFAMVSRRSSAPEALRGQMCL